MKKKKSLTGYVIEQKHPLNPKLKWIGYHPKTGRRQFQLKEQAENYAEIKKIN